MKQRSRMHPFILTLAAVFCAAFPLRAAAQTVSAESEVFVAATQQGETLFRRAGPIHTGDEYISRDNTLYRIVSVNGTAAVAEKIGQEQMPDVSWLDMGQARSVFAPMSEAVPAASDERRLIAMYVTHSDESYIPTDGTQSIDGQGGIYDVARAFRDKLQAEGIDVILDESTHLPHDAGAYKRSRRTAQRLLEHRPDAIIDIHRDGIPDETEYACTINGKRASQVRLLVGRGNQNSAVNREFAKQIKAVADKKYPDLIKDIFIGKGTYNQDLSPNAILLEFGTHTISKENVLSSTGVMADVVSAALYGETTGSAKAEKTASAAQTNAKEKSAMSGIGLLLAAVFVGVVIFALVQTGGGKAMSTKLRRNLSEMTGGLVGKKKNHDK